MEKPRVVHIHKAYRGLRIDRRGLISVIHTLDAHAKEYLGGCPPGELSLALLTDETLARIHGDFLQNSARTDVITFEGNPALGSAGEICVSVDAARIYATSHRRDFSLELTLYIIHGWLHLAGYDDLQPTKKRRMRSAEKRASALLFNANNLPIFIED